jgi:hypothetical protein
MPRNLFEIESEQKAAQERLTKISGELREVNDKIDSGDKSGASRSAATTSSPA